MPINRWLKSCFFLIFSASFMGYAQQRWTVLVYMDSSDALSDMAIKNITDLVQAGASKSVVICIQLHAYYSIAHRYTIHGNSLVPVDQVNLTNNPAYDLLDAAQWAFGNNPSEHSMLVLWNHGYGILDPVWSEQDKKWMVEPDSCTAEECQYCPSKRIVRCNHQLHKGFMFNADPRVYLTNKDLASVLQGIYALLGNRKLDILGFDTCMGAMVEISYKIEPYVKYHIGAQSCEQRDGWDYSCFNILKTSHSDPESVAKAIISAFDTYYKPRSKDGIYTMAAIDLSYITMINNAIVSISHLIQYCYDHYGNDFKMALRTAREQSPRFCFVPMYTDLYLFCTNLADQLYLFEPSQAITDLSVQLKSLCLLVKQAVIAHCGGTAIADVANGISIYFPHFHIDSSYYKTEFAKHSCWLDVLNIATS